MLSVDKVAQIRELAKQGYNKSKIAEKVACSRKTVNRYLPKEIDEKSEVYKKIFQMLNKEVPPVKIVEQIGYPETVRKQTKLFKKFKEEEYQKLINEIKAEEDKKEVLLKELEGLRERKEKEDSEVQRLTKAKVSLKKETASLEEKKALLNQDIKAFKKKYDELPLDVEVKKDLAILNDFLVNPTYAPPRFIALVVGKVVVNLLEWIKSGENERLFSGLEYPAFLRYDLEKVAQALVTLAKNKYATAPRTIYDSFIHRVLHREVDTETIKLAIKEGYSETIRALTHYPCNVCGKDMLLTRENLAKAVRKGKWAHGNCLKAQNA